MRLTTNQGFFLTLVSAGLWEKDVRLSRYEKIIFREIFRLAESQSVIGLVAAGIEHIQSEIPLPKEAVLAFVGTTLHIERRNLAMNAFIADEVEKMQEVGMTSLLVKGQGIAQCYSRPLWRTAGDIDFFFSRKDYPAAVAFFTSQDSKVIQNSKYTKSFGLMINGWFVEIHGTLRSTLSSRQTKEIDAVQKDTFDNHRFRVWKNGETNVLLPDVDNDIFFVFTHFVRHFYKEGCVIRQLCDWCRLLWTYRKKVDVRLLKVRLSRAGLLGEWYAFSAVAVGHLGMPVEAMPLYSEDEKWQKKSEKILSFILANEKSNLVRKTLALLKIFPMNTVKFLPGILLHLNWLKVKEKLFGCGNKNE